MKALESAFNQEMALVGALSVIKNLRLKLYLPRTWVTHGDDLRDARGGELHRHRHGLRLDVAGRVGVDTHL